VKPATPKTEPSQSTQLRKAVFAGSQEPFSLNRAASKKQIPISMKLNQTLLAMTIAAGLALAGEAQVNIVYDVNLAIGAGGVVGTITTDGNVGVIGASDILAWNLTVTGNGGVTFNFVNANSLVEVGNNTDVFNPDAGTLDLTADATNIYFNFSGTDGGYLGFQTPPPYGGEYYVSFGANNQSDTYQGIALVPVDYSDPSTITEAEAGNQIIASVPSVPPPGTQPSSFTYNNFATANLIRFNGSAGTATTSDGPVLELTPAGANQAGSAFTSNHIVMGPNDSFGTLFIFRLSHPVTPPAGGITFTIQSAGSSSLGGSGSGLGYSGIAKSLSVGFGAGNNVSVNTNGVLNAASVTNNALNDGNLWYAWVDYDGVSHDLEVRLSEIPVRPLAPTLAVGVNLLSVLGGTNAFVGFTGATGAGGFEQDILAWKFMALPTARFTGNFNVTNLPPGLLVSKGILLFRHIYVVAGVIYTNFSYVPFNTVSNANAQFAFASGIAELNPANALPDTDAIDNALRENAAALDSDDFMDYAMLAAYTNSASDSEGAVINYNNPDYIPFAPYYDNLGFPPFNMTEMSYDTIQDQVAANPPPGLDPTASLTQLQINDPSFPGPNNQPQWISMGPGGNIQGDSVSYSAGTFLGIVTARQQVIASPPEPSFISSPRSDGANFVFDFGTVSNQSYTVWANANLATTNWVGFTNLLGDGYVHEIAVPLASSPQQFFSLTSP
jgi:hypothetical protein